MASLVNHPFINQLSNVEIIDGDVTHARYNGISEFQSEDQYDALLQPLFNKFSTDVLPSFIADFGENTSAASIQLKLLSTKLGNILNQHQHNSNATRLRAELEFIDLKDNNNRPRYHVLRFLVSAWRVQENFIRLTQEVVDRYSKDLQRSEPMSQVTPQAIVPIIKMDEDEGELHFRLTPEYSKPTNRSVLTDIRSTLVTLGYLLPEEKDSNNTLANFRNLFIVTNEKSKLPNGIPIIWDGREAELKYLIKILVGKLIVQNFTEKSNNYIASKLFKHPSGKAFSTGRSKDKPSKSSMDKIDSVLGCLKTPTSKE